MSRKVGRLGESVFEQWTHQVGIVPNKVQQDETGWDFFIEFPQESAAQSVITLPLDKATPPLTCLIQVKSTENRAGRCPVKLSNWWRLVNNPVPTFFLVLEFDAEPNPQRAFLVHVDENYIGRVLKRLREIPPGEEPKLHKKTMQFTYDDQNALASLDGEGLAQAIRKHAGDNPLTYAEEKLQTLKRVGYEDVKGELNFSIMVPKDQIRDVHHYLVDFALGLIPSVEIRNWTYWDARFGIRESEPSERIEQTGELRIEREPVGEYDIQFRTQDGKETYQEKTTVYFPQAVSHLVDNRYLKVRCAVPYLNFIFWIHQPNFDVDCRFPPLDEPQKLSRVVPAARFLRFIHKATLQGGEVTLALSTQGQQVLRANCTIPITVDNSTLQITESILHAWVLCKHFDIHEAVETNIIELVRQKEHLQFLAIALGPLPDLRIASWLNPVIENTVREVCFPYVAGVVIGQHQIVFALAMLGEPMTTGRTNEHGTEYEVRINRVHIHQQHLYGRDEPLEFSGQALRQSIVDDYDQRQIPCILTE